MKQENYIDSIELFPNLVDLINQNKDNCELAEFELSDASAMNSKVPDYKDWLAHINDPYLRLTLNKTDLLEEVQNIQDKINDKSIKDIYINVNPVLECKNEDDNVERHFNITQVIVVNKDNFDHENLKEAHKAISENIIEDIQNSTKTIITNENLLHDCIHSNSTNTDANPDLSLIKESNKIKIRKFGRNLRI